MLQSQTCAIALLFLILAQSPAPQTPMSGVKRDALLNGLQVIVLDTPAPRVRCDLLIRAGSMFDLAGKAGLAAVTQETLLAVNPRLHEEIESLEGTISWGLGYDETWFRVDVPQKNFETAFEIISRLLVTENIRADAFKKAKEAQIEKARQIEQSLTPAVRADRALAEGLYGQHPYARSIDGTEATVSAIVQGDVLEFYKRVYIANDSSVIVTGPIGPDRVMRTFRVLFGSWVKGSIVPPTFRQPARTTDVKLQKINVADSPKVELRGGLIGVQVTDKDFLTTQVLARILQDRLKQSLGTDSAESIKAYALDRVLPGPVFFSASIPPDKAPQVSRAATDAFASFATNAPSEAELSSAKASLKGDKSAQTLADQLFEVERFGLPKNTPLTWPTRLDAVTSAEVQRVARRLLEANALTVVVLGPTTEKS